MMEYEQESRFIIPGRPQRIKARDAIRRSTPEPELELSLKTEPLAEESSLELYPITGMNDGEGVNVGLAL